MKSGVYTTEFWASIGTIVTSIITYVITLLVMRGVVPEAEQDVWAMLLTAVIGLVVFLASAWTATTYTKSRTELKKLNGNGY